jgi:hypothetical protein
MKTRWKILLGAVIFLAIFIGVWLLDAHVQPENVVEAYKKELRAKGEKLTLKEITPPPVPDEQNSADTVNQALGLMSSGYNLLPGAMKMAAPGKATPGWAQPDVRDYDFKLTNSWDDYRTIVGADRPGLHMLQVIFERPQLDFHLEYQKSFEMSLRHLAPLKQLSQKLSAAMECDLHDGDAASAATNLCVLLALVNGDADERVLISQLVRIAMANIGAADTWDFLQCSNVTDAQLAMIQKNWEQQQFIAPMEKAFWFERASTDETIQKLRASPAEFDKYMGSYGGSISGPAPVHGPSSLQDLLDAARFRIGRTMWRLSWSYAEQLQSLQTGQIILETLRDMETNTFYKPDCEMMTTRVTALERTNAVSEIFQRFGFADFGEMFGFGSALATSVRKVETMEVTKGIIVTAIALKRFQLANGHLPEKLSKLVPKFLESVPLDAVDGQPLRYRRNADGTFLLYSVGQDGIDDGGDPALLAGATSPSKYWANPKAHDWVWPQPATAAEIEKYYADEAAKKR